MTPGSSFLTSLHQAMTLSEHRYICFGSEYDFQVPYPYSIPNIKENQKNIYLNHYYGHTSPIVFPTIWNHVISTS
jgi:hypothetical protein